jgi:outer membrane protein OmpA-like peptidoglycan-associated protein
VAALFGAASLAVAQEAAPGAAQEAVQEAEQGAAQEAVQEAAQGNVQKNAALAKRSRIDELVALEVKLDNEFLALREAGVAAATPIYVEAKSRVRAASSVIEAKPGSKDAAKAFSACSTHVVAAAMQFEREANLVKARRMAAMRDSLLNVLHNLHEAISRIEGGRAYQLAQELEATKGKASLLQGDLEAAKANLALERERLRQVMAEAQRRFNELQSEIIQVSKDARGTIISMSDILFETGKATLTADLRTNLARIAGILMVYKEPNILVEGHTDNVGTREFNQKLSEDRATGVMNFLVENGVAQERLTAIGSAFDKPIADNATQEGRAKNRRVDLIIQDANLDTGDDEETRAEPAAAESK